MIVIENLTVEFEKKDILRSINLKVNFGDMIHIIGPNGSGKSTFFKCLLGAIPYKGTTNINPSDVAIVSDYTRIPEDLQVIDIIKFLNKTYSYNVKVEFTQLYNLCQLTQIENTKISRLSTGEKIRNFYCYDL